MLRLASRIAVATAVVCLALPVPATAASVSIYAQYESGSGATAVFGLYVANSLAVGVGEVLVLVDGSTLFGTDPANANISAVDSVYFPEYLFGSTWDVVEVNGYWSYAGGETSVTAIAPAGAVTRIGYFGAGDHPSILPGETYDPLAGGQIFEATFYDVNGNAIQGLTELMPAPPYPCSGECAGLTGVTVTVPEPAGALVAVALAAAILARSAT